jgi:exodeoxyribonuclease V alpha subunit
MPGSILGANKRGLHVDDGPNRHIFLKDHYDTECAIFRIVCALEGVRTKQGKTALSKSARIMVGSAEERSITFSSIQRECLAGLIEWMLCILTGGAGAGKSTLITALNDHYEGLLVVAVAAKAALRAHEISGARHTTIFGILRVDGGEDRWLPGVRVLVIEEASMVGSIQMAELLEAALHYNVRKIVLCGDPDQLAPIHNGSPFVDLISSGKVPVFRLTENHRTDPASLGIADFCREILGGEVG